MAVDALVGVDDTVLDRVADRATTDEVGGERHVERLADVAAGRAAQQAGHPAYGVVGHRDPGRVRGAVALSGGHPPAQQALLAVGLDRVVQRLHDQRDHGALGPVLEVVELLDVAALVPHLLQPAAPARLIAVAVGQHGLHQGHGVEALAVADRLDVGVGVGVEAGGDRDAVGVVRGVAAGRDGAQDRLGVGAREVAEAVRQPGQVALVLHPVQQLLGAQRGRREDDVLGGQRAGGARGGAACLGELHRDVVPAAVAGADPGDRGQRHHLRAVLLREVEVVLDQGVLGVVAAARHALAAVAAGVAVGASTAEERVGHLLVRVSPGAAEEHAHRRGVEGVAHAHVGGDLLHDVVGRGADGVLDDAEHPLGLVVVRRQLVAPVGDVAPLGVVVERRQRLVERVGVDQGPAADARAGHDHRVADRVDALDAVAAQGRGPQVGLDVEGAGGEVGVLEAGTRLDDTDLVALLGQSQRGDRAAEAGSDDQDVVVEGRVLAHGSGPPQLLHQAQVRGHDTGVLLVGHAQHRREAQQALRADRLGLGVAVDALAALAPAHAGLAHAAHR